jgi:hypothetical protein
MRVCVHLFQSRVEDEMWVTTQKESNFFKDLRARRDVVRSRREGCLEGGRKI